MKSAVEMQEELNKRRAVVLNYEQFVHDNPLFVMFIKDIKQHHYNKGYFHGVFMALFVMLTFVFIFHAELFL